MEALGRSFAPALLALAASGGAALDFEVVGAEHGSRAWVRPVAIALPRDFLRVDERLAVVAEGGAEVRAALDGAWARADGSIALARLELAPLPAGSTRLRVEARRASTAPPPPRPNPAATLAEVGDAARTLTLRVGTNAIAFDFGSAQLHDEGVARRVVRIAPRAQLQPEGAGARGGVELRFDDDGGEPLGVLRGEWCVAAGSDAIDLEVAFAAERDGRLERVSVAGRVTGERPRLSLGREEPAAEAGGERVLKAPLADLVRAQGAGASREPMTLRVGTGLETVELCWSDFALARPSAARLRDETRTGGRFELELVAEPLLLRAGQTVRRRLLLRAARQDGIARTRAWLVPAARPRGFDEATRAVLEAWREFLTTELLAPARIDDRGCYLTPKGERADGEYDLAGNLFWLGAREGDARWLELARTCARHTLDFDRIAAPVSGAPPGLFFMHGEEHQSGRVEAGHQWIEGLLGLARNEGALDACEAARGLVRALDSWRAERASFEGPERRLAWPLLAAAAALEVSDDEAARRLANGCAGDLLARQRRAGFIDGDRRTMHEGSLVWVNAWVSAGITADALARAAPHAGSRLDEAARRLVQFVASEGMSRDGCAEVLLVDPATEQVVKRQGRCRRGDAALVAAGVDRIAQGEPGFSDLRDGLFALALADLAEPRREEVEQFAKLLLALRQRCERRDAAQSFKAPSNSRGRPREK
jgi:hypothetical protein